MTAAETTSRASTRVSVERTRNVQHAGVACRYVLFQIQMGCWRQSEKKHYEWSLHADLLYVRIDDIIIASME